MAHEVNLEIGDRDTVLDTMFAHHPNAMVVAVNDNGLFTRMPTIVPLQGQHVISSAPSALELVVPDDRVAVIEAWERLLRDGVANALVHPVHMPGETVRLHFVDSRHRYGVILAFVTDFTGHFGGASGLNEIEVVPRVGVVRKDPVAVITRVDEATPRMLGWAASELIGRRALDLVHPDDHQRAIESWMDMLASPGAARRVRLRHQHRDGHYLWLEVTNHNLLNSPEHNCVVAEMLNISDELAAQEALAANERLLRRLTEALPVGVTQIDPDLRITYQNERAVEMFGERVGTAIDPGKLENDGPRVVPALLAALGENVDSDMEVVYLSQGGEYRRAMLNIRPLAAGTGVVVCATDITEAARLREELRHLATYDALTGCLNRASILAALEEPEEDRDSGGTAVVFLDLNEFKEINDSLGHAAGDALLRYVGDELRSAVRNSDLIGRLGGDEFLVVARDVAGLTQARQLGEHIAAHLAGCALDLGGRRVQIRASIGIAWARRPDLDADALVARADAAMYQAKRQRSGRLGLVVSTSHAAA
jgi:diguanylate cyclase (GGDEF)-like protein/PAS domain S-box-containing protein